DPALPRALVVRQLDEAVVGIPGLRRRRAAAGRRSSLGTSRRAGRARRRPRWSSWVCAPAVLLLHAVGLSDRAVGGIALVAAGLALVWHRRGTLRPDSPRAYAGLALAGLGVVLLLQGEGGTTTLLPPGAVAGA